MAIPPWPTSARINPGLSDSPTTAIFLALFSISFVSSSVGLRMVTALYKMLGHYVMPYRLPQEGEIESLHCTLARSQETRLPTREVLEAIEMEMAPTVGP